MARKNASSAPASTRVVLFTGFPGFIGARLVPRLLELDGAASFRCLVQQKYLDVARETVARLERSHPFTTGRIELVPGDVAAPGLGIGESAARALQRQLSGCFHLAAAYDLAVPRETGLRVNVEGTKNVLSFLGDCPRLERFDYVSTAYVSGTAVGVFRETDLDVGQSFRNAYEETKFLAEEAVRSSGLPATTYRPAIVVGDSRTGETGKFDGPYFALNAMRRLPSPGVFVRVGSGRNPVNLVPVDFVLEAVARLSTWAGSVGKTYHLTDPSPLSASEISELFAKALGKQFVYVPVPTAAARLLFSPGPVERFFGMPAVTLDYFDHPLRYDNSLAAADLAPFGLSCPRFPDYVQALVAFYRAHADEITRGAMT